MIEYFLANEIEFPKEMMRIIETLKGKPKHKHYIKVSDIISQIYDVSYNN